MNKKLLSLVLASSFLLPLSTMSAKATTESIVKQTTGIATGVTAGPVIGGTRGFVKGWIWGTDATAEALGDKDGVPHKIIGFFTGGVVGAVAGGISGIGMGAYDGLKYGYDKPLSSENYSAAGKSFTDYDPFKWEE